MLKLPMGTYAYVRAHIPSSGLPSIDQQIASIKEFTRKRALGSVTSVIEETNAEPDEFMGPTSRARLLFGVGSGDVVISQSFACLFTGPADATFFVRFCQSSGARVFLVDPEWELTAEGEVERFCTLMDGIRVAIGAERARAVTEAKRKRKESAVYLGGSVPFGFRKTRVGDMEKLEPDPDQQRAIARAFQLRSRGWSLQRIAKDLQAKGHQISHVTVSRILKTHIEDSA